jgi:tripartite-type tricarboxylate transporter receptor subunit TctC
MTAAKIILIFYLFLLWFAPAHAQNNFFAGKTIRIVVGSSPGGGYDYWGRLLAATCQSTYAAILKWSCKTCLAPDRSQPPTTSTASPNPTA